MSQRIGIAIVALAALAGVGWMLFAERNADVAQALERTDVDENREQPAQNERVSAPSTPLTEASERSALEPGAATVTESKAPPEKSALEFLRAYVVSGRALDLGGSPLSDVSIGTGPDAELARTGPDGIFRFETLLPRFELEGALRGWTTVRVASVDRGRAEREVRVVLAPAVALSGQVVDPDGLGIAGASLELTSSHQGIAGFPLPLDDTRRRDLSATTDEEGRFDLPAVPRLESRPLRVSHDGFEPSSLEVPEQDQLALRIELELLEEDADAREPVLFGNVRFPAGEPVEGATILTGKERTTSDRDGRFELPRPSRVNGDTLLVALFDGWQPALFKGLGPLLEEQSERVGPIDLSLPGEELFIRGRFELADGSPGKGWRVQLKDPTVLDETTSPAPTIENRGETSNTIDNTDARGRFEIRGLRDRDYELRVWNPKSFISIESGQVPAGEQELVLRLPEDALLERLEGHVRTRDGSGAVGVNVAVQFIMQRTRTGFTWDTTDTTRTDEDGAFTLRDLPRRGVNLVVNGSEIVSLQYEPPDGEFDGAPLELIVDRLLRVRIDASRSEPVPDTFQLLNAAGDALMIEARSAFGKSSSSQGRLDAGLSPVLAVSEAATTLVLRLEGEELERREVVLIAGGVNEL